MPEQTKQMLREKFSGEKSCWYGIRGENHPRYGTTMPQDAKDAISNKNRKENWSEETKRNKMLAAKRQSIYQIGHVP